MHVPLGTAVEGVQDLENAHEVLGTAASADGARDARGTGVFLEEAAVPERGVGLDGLLELGDQTQRLGAGRGDALGGTRGQRGEGGVAGTGLSLRCRHSG